MAKGAQGIGKDAGAPFFFAPIVNFMGLICFNIVDEMESAMKPIDNANHHSLLSFTTQRLTLRQLEPSDAEAIYRLRSDARVNLFIDRPTIAATHEALIFITKIINGVGDGNWFYWAITLRHSQELIGTICLWNFSDDKTVAELGYELMSDFHRQGLMHEAVASVIKQAFAQLPLKAIKAYTHRDNLASTKLLVKNKFERLASETDPDNLLNWVYELKK
jgi:ribosomal-protein-alanine N-acetyltransferase